MANIDPRAVGEPIKKMLKPVKRDLRNLLEQNKKDSETGFVVEETDNGPALREIEIDITKSKLDLKLEKKSHKIKEKIDALYTDFVPVIKYCKQNEDKVSALGHTHPPNAECLDVFNVGFESINMGDYLGYIMLESSGITAPKLVAYLDKGEVNLEGYWKMKPLKTRL